MLKNFNGPNPSFLMKIGENRYFPYIFGKLVFSKGKNVCFLVKTAKIKFLKRAEMLSVAQSCYFLDIHLCYFTRNHIYYLFFKITLISMTLPHHATILNEIDTLCVPLVDVNQLE